MTMRSRKKKGPSDDTGDKPQHKTNETLPPEATERTKDAPVEASKSKPNRLKAWVWFFVKLMLLLAVLAVLFVLFMMFALPRILSEMEVYI